MCKHEPMYLSKQKSALKAQHGSNCKALLACFLYSQWTEHFHLNSHLQSHKVSWFYKVNVKRQLLKITF